MSEPPIDPPVEEEIIEGWNTAPVTGDRVNVFDAPIIAGDPVAGRIEIRSTGIHAFNGVGTETAHIDGSEGVFVGGEFRTSDTLPGQAKFADDAFDYGGARGPGLSIEPVNAAGYTAFPGIGPADGGMVVSGGSSGDGSSGVAVRPGVAQTWAYGADGGYSQSYTTDVTSRLERYGTDGALQSRIQVLYGQVILTSVVDGVDRHFRLDADGVRVGTAASGTFRWYNLEETAQDSGWNAITMDSGTTGAGNPAWRNKGGVVYFRGTASRAWTGNGTWDPIATGLPPEIRPQTRVHILSPSVSVNQLVFRVGTDGSLEGRRTNEGTPSTFNGELSGIIYPTG